MAKTSITITTITCNKTTGTDDVYVIWQPDCGFPVRVPQGWENNVSMNANLPAWDINLTMEFDDDVLVTLYDADINLDPFSSDFIGCYDFTPLNVPTSASVTNQAKDTSYTLTVRRNS